MTRIIQGVLAFQQRIFGKKRELFWQLGQGQRPLALFITCSDSRIDPTLLTQSEPGELFELRNAGNLVPPFGAGSGAEAATIEYAVRQLHVRDIILCGHARCGAVHGLLELASLGHLPAVAAWLEHAREVLPRVSADLPPERRLDRAIEQNVLVQLEHLRGHPAVREGLEARTLRLHGWVYHFETGAVDAYHALRDAFTPVEQHLRQKLLHDGAPDTTPRTEWECNI